jgi:hypothetical protein
LYLNKERTIGNVGEDIYIKNMNISEESKKSIIRVISYFLFCGTVIGKSKYPSNSILEIQELNDIKKWKFYNYIKKNILCNPWIFHKIRENNIIKEKGSLHIRLKK